MSVGGCCRFTGAVAMIPLAAILAVMLETPTIIKLDSKTAASQKEGVEASTESRTEGARPADATEESSNPSVSRMGSGSMFDRIAFAYDATNKWMSLGLDQHWRKTMVQECLRLERDDKALDLATGTADVSLLVGERLKHLGDGKASIDSVIGLDPSTEMLRIGVTKVESKGLEGVVRLVKGDAQDLSGMQTIDAAGSLAKDTSGLRDESVDKITMSFGIRNVPERRKALQEMRRVLRKRPSSRVCILEFSLPSNEGVLSSIARKFITHVIPVIGQLATFGHGSEEYDYFQRSIIRFPEPLAFASELQAAGLPVQSITTFAYGAVNLYAASPAV
eukprot:TRINITY_DN35783_c0_g1_i1.p1 TRINITY_DN35783_c0_g1~~TRINITY_DN35783_c0_g1_i1.p1  ORF type:complete len:334 (-),score=71.18 TRINITY_DN35783_c0_g1_i1:27-1028(-)